MNEATRGWAIGGMLAAFLAAWPIAAQKPHAPASAEKTRQVLIGNAHALESRGRPDMAVQIWQQVLLSDPNNVEALVGLARDYKLSGHLKESQDTLERLRSVHPGDPNIAKIEALASTNAQSDQLRQAGELARQGRNDEAMSIYRQLYGEHPPEGDIALAYYQTLYGTLRGKEQAIAGLRALSTRNPGNPQYAVALGRMLTYEARTRAEGIRILQAHAQSQEARDALRQALIWDAANPNSASELRQYAKEHPQDTEIARHLKEDEAKLAQINSGLARTAAEQAAFAALNAHRLDLAQSRFMAILNKEPRNSRAAAGMGFVRMQQKNFSAAISYFAQAEEYGYRATIIQNALESARFFNSLSEAAQAFDQDQLDVAAAKYRDALAMRPRSPEALNGLAGVYTKQQQYTQAAATYDEILKMQPRNADAWRGLFLAYARDGQNQRALETANRFPAAVRDTLGRDPEYLRTLATVYRAINRPDEAQRVLMQALSLPFPENGAHLKADTKLQYAGILMEAQRFDQAAEMYTQILTDDPSNVSAWMGLVSAHHQMNLDNAAIADVERMPPATYEASLADTGFLTMLAGIYQQANRFDVAQSLLDRAVKLETANGRKPSVQLQLQIAAVDLHNGKTHEAYAIYRQVLSAHPDRLDAWKGLIASLQATNHSNEALQQIGLIPPAVRKQLEADVEFVQTEASVYAATGETAQAFSCMNRVQSYYARLHTPEPPNVAIQNAWLLYNTGNDRSLYGALMRLGSRQDLTAPQRETVQTIWANWSVKRASAAMENNNGERAVAILEAASAAFPDNLTVRKVLAGGYLQTGRPREALAIFKSVPMEDATPADFQTAIGAALGAKDRNQAEQWLRLALDRFPNDYRVLGMAARYEQARGDNQRAADYWRAALAATPKVSATDKLAHELAYPDQDTRPHKARTAAELQDLLNPNNEPFPKTAKLPPLPSYGFDPYNGTAPVVPAAQPATQPEVNAPATTEIPIPGPSVAPQGATPNAVPPASASPEPRKRTHKSSTGGPGGYTGVMHIPASEEDVTSTESEPTKTSRPASAMPVPAAPAKPQRPMFVPVPQVSSNEPVQGQPARTESGMDSRAAQAQAWFAEQTDAQLTGGQAQVRPLSNAAVNGPSTASTADGTVVQYRAAQYTPSAQEAATGAYSAQKPAATEPQPQTAQPAAEAPRTTRRAAKRRKAKPAAKTETVPTLATAPGEANQQPVPVEAQQSSPEAPQATSPSGVSDEQLQERNLPPLRGPWVRVQRQPRAVSPREEVQQQLTSLESSYSGWLSGAGAANYRSGNLGYDRLAALEAPFEASAPLGYQGRITIVAKPVFLDSGQADGTAVMQVQEATTAGRALVTIPEPIGTDVNTGATTPGTTTTTAATPPPQQNATGIGGEVQLAFPTLSLAGGYTPYGFLVANWMGRFQWRPGNGPVTINLVRDSVKDSQLSYGGLRDPGTMSLAYPGSVWGGVVANQGNVQIAHGDAQSGFYVGAGGQYITGFQVQTNNRIEGTGGAYWRAYTAPEYGTLSIGANFFGMHYQHNENAFTFGMGGYFSPQAYFLANVPFTWEGHYLTKWHYEVLGGVGVQAFQEDSTPLFPLAGQKASEIALNNAALPAVTSVGANYNLRSTGSYQIGDHWFAGGFLSANNTRNYNAVSIGFSIHYLFRTQPSTAAGPTGLFPNDGFRPFNVP